MLPSEVDVLLWHAMSNGLNVACSVYHADLKVAIAPIASIFIIAPLSGQKTKGFVALRVSWQPRIVRLKEILKLAVTILAFESPDRARDVR